MTFEWEALLKDGTPIYQCDDRGRETLSAEDLDRDEIKAFSLWNVERSGIDGMQLYKTLILSLILEEGQRLIYRRRREMQAGKDEPKETCHLLGWQMLVHIGYFRKNIQSINYCFEESGKIISAGKFDPNHPWFYPIVLTEKEKKMGLEVEVK